MKPTTLIILVSLLFLSTVGQSQNFSKIDFASGAGLYYERLPRVYTIGATWNFVTYVALDTFLSQIPVLPKDKKIDLLSNDCDEVEYGCEIKAHKKAILSKLSYLEEQCQQLKTLLPPLEISIKTKNTETPLKSITKRDALYEDFGVLGKLLFGFLTLEDARAFDEGINQLRKSISDNAYYSQKKTHFIRSSFHKIHERLINLDKRTLEIESSMGKYDKYSPEKKEKLKEGAVLELMQLTEQKIQIFESKLQLLIESITLAKEGILHPELLPPQQLIKSIAMIKQSHPHLSFPIINAYSEPLHKILNVNLYYDQGRLVIFIRIPLLNNNPFEAYNIHPLPFARNVTQNFTSSIFIKPENDVLVLSSDRESYLGITTEELSRCKRINDKIICDFSKPFKKINMLPSCESQMLLNPSIKSLELCELRLSRHLRPYWSKLETQNSWLYSVPVTERLQINCMGIHSETILLKGIGILQLKPGCEGRVGPSLIPSFSSFETTSELIYEPKFNITIDSFFNLPISISTLNELFPQTTDYSSESDLQLIQDSLALKDIEEKFKEIQRQNSQPFRPLTAPYSYGGISFGSLIIILIILYYCCVRSKRNNPSVTVIKEPKRRIQIVKPQSIPPTDLIF